MRDLINLIDMCLTEAVTLNPTQIKKRFHLFVSHIRNNKPFYTEQGDEVYLDPDEADRFQELYDQDKFKGSLTATDVNGKQWSLNSFLKTKDFGGQAVPPGQEISGGQVGKETLLVKPTQIGITDKNFTASTLFQAIVNNSVLQSTEYGKVVIDTAKNIVSGSDPMIPLDLVKSSDVKKAIVDYAGEYLGVLALVYGRTDFPKKDAFLDWLGGDLSSLVLRFPSKANLAIADSFATIINPESEQQINISSKGTGGGAAPSLSGIVVPDHLKRKSAFKDAVDFIEVVQNKTLPSPSTVSQVYAAMNLLHERHPDSIPDEFSQYLPWTQSDMMKILDSVKTGTELPEFQNLWETRSFRSEKATDGGKLTYVVKQAVIDAVNSGALPSFESAVLEILDYNFVQQYTSVQNKSGLLTFHTQWPAKLDGSITLETKSGAPDPTKGGFSFKLSPKGQKKSGSTSSGTAGDSRSTSQKSSADTSPTAMPNVITGKRVDIKPKPSKSTGGADLGRKRRS